MAKVFVVYDTKYGNTRYAAKLIAEGLKDVEGTDAEIDYVKNVDLAKLATYDAIIIGAPNHMGKPSRIIGQFINKLAKNNIALKRVAVFDTYYVHQRNFEKAMKKMEKSIGEKLPGAKLITHGLSVKVKGVNGPVAEEELVKCRELGRSIAAQLRMWVQASFGSVILLL